MNFPVALKYTQEHEWIKIEGDIAVVGITDFAQGELGDIVFVEVESIGKNIIKDGVFGTVEAVKTVSDLFFPVSGEVIEFNTALNNNPELIHPSTLKVKINYSFFRVLFASRAHSGILERADWLCTVPGKYSTRYSYRFKAPLYFLVL